MCTTFYSFFIILFCGHSGSRDRHARATDVVKGESDGGKQTETSLIQRLGRRLSENVNKRSATVALGVAVAAGVAQLDPKFCILNISLII